MIRLAQRSVIATQLALPVAQTLREGSGPLTQDQLDRMNERIHRHLLNAGIEFGIELVCGSFVPLEGPSPVSLIIGGGIVIGAIVRLGAQLDDINDEIVELNERVHGPGAIGPNSTH